jgi:molybdate transport system ATP-binding protein
MSPPALEARLTVRVGDRARPFSVEVELDLAAGTLVLFGPSGAGKSLTLMALAGLLRPVAGFLRVGGETVFDAERRIFVPPERRRIGYVPQHDALFPFLDVADNVAFGLRRADRRRDHPRVVALLEQLGLEALADRRPESLSGGERQRVALARALAVEPRLLLLDEPFASIDEEGRATLRRALREALSAHRTPAVLVTHDADEALALGDRLVLFETGRTTLAGDPGPLLGRGKPVIVRGHAVGQAEELGDGRARVTLRDATIDGPAELLEAGGGERLRIELRSR